MKLLTPLLLASALSLTTVAAEPKHNTALSGGKLPKPVKVSLVKVAGGFVDPVRVSLAPGDNNRLFVCERTGIVRLIKNGKVQDKPFLDIHETVVSSFLEQGLYDLEFHPKFAENGKFYVHYSDMWFNGAGFIVEYQVSKTNPDKADPESARVVFQMPRPYANHNGGEIAFGPDGYLYIGSGDGGWEGDVLGAGQDLSTWLAKILRIDVNPSQPDRGYSIPKDNPFITPASQMKLFGVTEEAFNKIHPNAKPEIWSYGLRNPWSFQFDPKNGDMYIADIGQNHYEEVNFEPHGKAGVNYGWKFMCGTHPFPLPLDASGKPDLDAVKDAPRVGEAPHLRIQPCGPGQLRHWLRWVPGLQVPPDGRHLLLRRLGLRQALGPGSRRPGQMANAGTAQHQADVHRWRTGFRRHPLRDRREGQLRWSG